MLSNALKQKKLNLLSNTTVHPNHTRDTSTGVKTVEENGLLKVSFLKPSTTMACVGLQVLQDRSLFQENGRSGTIHPPVDKYKELWMAGMIMPDVCLQPCWYEIDHKWHRG